MNHPRLSLPLLTLFNVNMAKHILGQWDLVASSQRDTSWQNGRKTSAVVGPSIISFVDSPFRPMLNILARLIFQLIPTACPNHFATGDVYTLLSILKSAPVDADLILVNQDLAGFFTSIDQDRFIRSWFMLLDFLRPKMNVFDGEAFSVYPGKSNNPGDIIKGRTFRCLNVTRKIVIGDVPDLIKSALNMQTFALGQRCVRQSPTASPLSPALCLMVVSISEQIWHNTFHLLLSIITTCSFDMSAMSTTVSFSETNASPRLRHTKSSWMTDSMENRSSSKPNQIRNSSASCLKQSH